MVVVLTETIETEIMKHARLVQAAANDIFNLAEEIANAKTKDGTSLHADTLSTIAGKVPAARTVYEAADVAFRAAMKD